MKLIELVQENGKTTYHHPRLIVKVSESGGTYNGKTLQTRIQFQIGSEFETFVCSSHIVDVVKYLNNCMNNEHSESENPWCIYRLKGIWKVEL